MIRRRVLALSLVPVLVSAVLAVAGARVAPARAETTTRQIPSGGTTSIRGGPDGSGALQNPEFSPGKKFASDVTPRVAAARAAATDRSLSDGLRGRAAATVTGAASTPSPRLLRSIDGLNHRDQRTANGGNQFSLEPPDQGLCVGNGFVLETINDVLRVYDTKGNPLTGVTDQNTFYGYPPAINRTVSPPVFGPFMADPSCLFDTFTRRWFHVILTLDVNPATGDFLGTNHIDIAVSNTSDPRGEWAIYRLPAHNNGADGTPNHNCEGGFCLGDYPQIGADAFGFYVTTNEYPFFADGFHAAQLYAFNKFALARNAPTVNVTHFDTIGMVGGNPGFTLRGSTSPTSRYELAQGGTEYFLSSIAAEEANGTGTADRILIWSLTRTATLLTSNPQPVLRFSSIDVGAYSISPKADQKPGPFPLGECINDTTIPTPFGPGCWNLLFVEEPDHDEVISHLDASDSRMHQVVLADGKLWSALDTAVNVGSATPKAGVEFFVVDPRSSSSGPSGTIVKQGYLGVRNNNLTYPAVGVTASGRAVIAMTLVGADHYASAAYAGLSARTGAGPVRIAAAGKGVSDGFTSYKAFVGDPPRTRWGDYGAAVGSGDTIWIASEYINQSCTLAEWLAGPEIGSCGGTRTALANWATRFSEVKP
jgi:hypothetical protein